MGTASEVGLVAHREKKCFPSGTEASLEENPTRIKRSSPGVVPSRAYCGYDIGRIYYIIIVPIHARS